MAANSKQREIHLNSGCQFKTKGNPNENNGCQLKIKGHPNKMVVAN